MKKGTIITRLVAVMAIVAMIFCMCACQADEKQPVEKEITVTVVYADKTQKKFDITTEAENLGDALFEAELVTEEEHKTGFYISIDGVRADYTLDKAWWCFTKGGEMAAEGANDLAIADGENFEITYTPA